MKKTFLFIGIFLALIPINFYSLNDNNIGKFKYLSHQVTDKKEKDSLVLKKILKKTAAYCEKLHDLNFTLECTAEIEETIFHPVLVALRGEIQPHTREKSQYVYQYHFKKFKDIIDEKWILLKENGVAKNTEVTQPDLKRFYTIWPLYGPLEFLSSIQQELYSYEIKDKETIEDQKAYVIQALPKSPDDSDKDRFLIWISMEDFSILKIVWFQSTLDDPNATEEIIQTQNAEPRIELTAEYLTEASGIRLPTKYSINEEYQRVMLNMKKSKTTVHYKKYSFSIENKDNLNAKIK